MPAVATGSHIDAIPHAGKFDGVVGVLGGLEAIRALQRAGFRPERSIELIQFTAEEPTRFGVGCIGSRLLSGTLGAGADDRLRGSDDQTLRVVRDQRWVRRRFRVLFVSARVITPLSSNYTSNRGLIFERESISIGVVTNIAAPASSFVTVEGPGRPCGRRTHARPSRRSVRSSGVDHAD